MYNYNIYFTFTFTFMHLADAFIQSIQVILFFFWSVYVFSGNRTHKLLGCWRNALTTATQEHFINCFIFFSFTEQYYQYYDIITQHVTKYNLFCIFLNSYNNTYYQLFWILSVQDVCARTQIRQNHSCSLRSPSCGSV